MLDMSGLPERVKYLENTEINTINKKKQNIFQTSVTILKEGCVSSHCSTLVASLAKKESRSNSFSEKINHH